LKVSESRNQYLISACAGKKVLVSHNGKQYTAEVTKWDPVEPPLWHVQHSDGDEEDLSESEMLLGIQKFAQQNRSSKRTSSPFNPKNETNSLSKAKRISRKHGKDAASARVEPVDTYSSGESMIAGRTSKKRRPRGKSQKRNLKTISKMTIEATPKNRKKRRNNRRHSRKNKEEVNEKTKKQQDAPENDSWFAEVSSLTLLISQQIKIY
jgi:hypothetical protein